MHYLDLVYVSLLRADGLRVTVSLQWYAHLSGASHYLRYGSCVLASAGKIWPMLASLAGP